MRCGVALALLAVLLGSQVHAHEVEIAGNYPHDFEELVHSWSFEPGIVIPLGIGSVAYVTGVLRLWRVMGWGRGVRWAEFWCGVMGWFSLAVALISPLHAWGDALFAAHMTQHELLMLVAAPLLVLARPVVALLWSLPRSWPARMSAVMHVPFLRQSAGIVTQPLAAWAIHAVVLWAWHVPVLFNATLSSDLVHGLQHLSFFGSALLFWWAIMHGKERAAAFGVAVLFLFTTALHSGLLGVLLTFARTPWYAPYLTRTQSWGLTPLQDQQIGGLIMWVPAGVVYVIAGLALFAAWLREAETRTCLHERESCS